MGTHISLFQRPHHKSHLKVVQQLKCPDKQSLASGRPFQGPNPSFAVQSLSRIRLFETPWTAACEASLSFTISQSLLKLMSIGAGDAIQPSHSLLPPSPAFNLSQHQGLFQGVGSSNQVAKGLDMGFPGSSAGRESACNAGDLGSISGLGRSPRVGSHKESDRTERLSRSLSILWHHNS